MPAGLQKVQTPDTAKKKKKKPTQNELKKFYSVVFLLTLITNVWENSTNHDLGLHDTLAFGDKREWLHLNP